MKNKQLSLLYQNAVLPSVIKGAIKEVLDEDEAYVADELVELSELVLLELAALGIAAYLNQPKQKSVYNDFLLQLFTTKSHSYNAGPLYRWAANMIKELDTMEAKILYPLFWEKVGKTEQLNVKIHHLALLRNEVMHGFFLLPPKRNNKEAKHIAGVLAELDKAKIFSLFKVDNFHFFSKENKIVSYNGRWKIEDEEWKEMQNAHAFGELSKSVRHQLSESFDKEQVLWLNKNANRSKLYDKLIDFISNNNRGALAIWHRPNENIDDQVANIYAFLEHSDKYLPQFLSLTPVGVSYTSKFLLTKLTQTLLMDNDKTKFSRDPLKTVRSIREKCIKQPVIIVKNVHQSLFQSDHMLHLADFFHQNKILLIAFGIHYKWMNQFFNDYKPIEKPTYVPKKSEWLPLLDNYLRFKGPNIELEGELRYYKLLEEVITQAIMEISSCKHLVARHFADKHNYPIEYVHEAFAFLHPFFKADRLSFEEDVLDELYGFPKKVSEASNIYFSIGRRDAKLEYQHHTLAL